MSAQLVKRGDGAPPVYRQISDLLREEIQTVYGPGDQLSSETELADRFGVNRHTLRRAVEELINDGLVARQHGKGIYVLTQAINYAINSHTRFTQTLEDMGMSTDSRVLAKHVIAARDGVAMHLGINSGAPVIFVETIRKVAGKPFCVISHFIPKNEFPAVLESYEGGSLHAFLQSHYGIHLKRSGSLISAVMPSEHDTDLLSMPRNLPVLRVKSVNLSMDREKPVEYAVTRFRSDAAQLSIKP